jgi:hypothetical protein
MKLRNALSSWTILIPSLVLNVALLLAAVYFLNQLEFFYQQASGQVSLVRARTQRPIETAPRLAVHTALTGGGDLAEPHAAQP